jgi:excinuclease ABC subunit A
MPKNDVISVRGAREHNLKSIDVDIPRDKLTVITGVSGSGKSSLAFDTIYAEGQRRYVESLSAYARQFLDIMGKPDVDSITGLSPAISIEQKTTNRNPRSTVGTITEIYDYLRLLFARCGTPYSPATGLPITALTISQMTDKILSLPSGTRAYLLAPMVRDRKGEYKAELAHLQKQGFMRVKIDGQFYEIDECPDIDRNVRHNIDVVVDRLVISPESQSRIAQSLDTALSLSDGIAMLQTAPSENSDCSEEIRTFSAKFSCPVSGFCIPEIEPRLFSFNAPMGRCSHCDGIGSEAFFDPELCIPNPELTLNQGAIMPWLNDTGKYRAGCAKILETLSVPMDIPWQELPESTKNMLLYGYDLPTTRRRGRNRKSRQGCFSGIIQELEILYARTSNPDDHEQLVKFRTKRQCTACHGYRLKQEPLCVKIGGIHIGEVCNFTIVQALLWIRNIHTELHGENLEIASRIIREIETRLSFLADVGLNYLSLSRESGTLSGGESQRIRLASQIGSGLTGVLYVLDEPSIGLHQRDNNRLINTLKNLRDLGNTVLVVEHDMDAILNADHLIDMGSAGEHGGHIIAAGTPEAVMKCKESLTADYLTNRKSIPCLPTHRNGKGQSLTIRNASGNNLKNVTVSIPIGCMTCVTGVSGSGKSTLILDTLYRAAARTLNRAATRPAPHESIELASLDKVISIDQSPIGRTPRSNPVTYTNTFTLIREWYAGLPESKARGYQAGRFSFNVRGGRCECCQGEGVRKIQMHFLPDIHVMCDVCRGSRYNRETLEILYKNKSIADILNMTVQEGRDFFQTFPAVYARLDTLLRVGLGYMRIGQRATTLSGGEAQRVKLAKELSKRATGDTLYILDEPTTGLHFEDVKQLLGVLYELVDSGNTIVIIEHNLDVIRTADWIIDLGPEGGNGGGNVIAQGTPEDIAKHPKSHTGYHLKNLIKRHQDLCCE